MTQGQDRRYIREDVVTFRRTGERYGGLSNMAPGFAIGVNGLRVRTAEALYQACRFPHLPEVQRAILEEGSPMTAKMRSKPHRGESRADWDDVRVRIMKWCLRAKLACHPAAFGRLLLSTGTRAIVEDSRRDRFWGAVPGDDGTLAGENVLGRLLMDLRARLEKDPQGCRIVRPLPLRDFTLLGAPIQVIDTSSDPVQATERLALL